MRPGRFDTNVVVPLPDVKGREQLLELYVKPVPLEDDVKLGTIARACQGFSGADISNLVNVAALKASSDECKAVGMSHLEYASDPNPRVDLDLDPSPNPNPYLTRYASDLDPNPILS